jgi:uncharacterized protein
VTLYTAANWLEQVGPRLAWFPLHRVDAVFILPTSIAIFLVGIQLTRLGPN